MDLSIRFVGGRQAGVGGEAGRYRLVVKSSNGRRRCDIWRQAEEEEGPVKEEEERK